MNEKRTLSGFNWFSLGWDSNFLQGNINNPNMFAKLINKKYKPSKAKKGEILTSKQKLTKFLVVRISKEKQYFLNQQYVKKDKRYPV